MLDLNHNAIRQHLNKSVDAGLVTRRPAPVTGRGRPRQLYEVHPGVDSRWEAGGPYLRLSLLLVEIIRSGDDPVEVGRRAGRVAELRIRPDHVAAAALERAMAREGFVPSVDDDGEVIEFVLGTCPFAETVAADPETICSLHLGLAQGLAEQFDGVAADSLEPREPTEAGCRYVSTSRRRRHEQSEHQGARPPARSAQREIASFIALVSAARPKVS